MTASSQSTVSADDINGAFVPRARPSVASLELDGDVVLLDSDTSAAHHLDPVAGIVWSCFDGSGTIDEIVADLSAEFAGAHAQIYDDVINLTRQLGGDGLLEGVAPASGPPNASTHQHGPVLCEDPDHHPANEPMLYTARPPSATSEPSRADAVEGDGAREPRFLLEPPSS